VEEFVFRGYIQRQCQVLRGRMILRTFLSRLGAAGSGSSDRSLVDGRSALAQKPSARNDRPWFWGWSCRLFVFC
jgi:hypothetical protein